MITLNEFEAIYIYPPFVDFRKSIDGLSGIVTEQMHLNCFDSSLFIFCNKRRTRLKILYWDKTGFALWYKLLENDLFKWPKFVYKESFLLSKDELVLFLQGIDFWNLKTHKKLDYKYC